MRRSAGERLSVCMVVALLLFDFNDAGNGNEP
jgi:hypothetical protein